jgi:CheY-like chemotaxis protein
MASDSPIAGPAAAAHGESTLLLADDNPLNREWLATRLRGHGYVVQLAETGEQALEMLGRTPVDLVLLDSMMPGLSGYEVLQRIKSDPQLRDIPVLIVSGLDENETVASCIGHGAEGYVPSPFDPVLLQAQIDAALERKRLREQEARFLAQLQKEKDHSDRLINVVIPIGIAFTREKDNNRLIEKILVEAKKLCNADGGTLYLRTLDERLEFAMLRNTSLNIAMGGTSGNPIPFPPLALFDPETDEPNHHLVACHVALTNSSVNIPDAYDAEGFDFRGTKEFDRKMGYHSRSFLAVPLRSRNGAMLGVLQLINAQDPKTREAIPFDPMLQQSVESLGLLAGAALESLGVHQRTSA